MTFPFEPTPAQARYDGPDDLAIFADFLPALGEIVISFSRVERRLTWALESVVGTTIDEARELEDFVKNVTARIAFLDLVGRPVARETKTEDAFLELVQGIRDANKFRNNALHNGFTGIGGPVECCNEYIVKERHNSKIEKRSYRIHLAEFRSAVISNIVLCGKIQAWVLSVRPHAENRVP